MTYVSYVSLKILLCFFDWFAKFGTNSRFAATGRALGSASQDFLSFLCPCYRGRLPVDERPSATQLRQLLAVDLAKVQDVATFLVEPHFQSLQRLCHFLLVEPVGRVAAGPAGLAEAEQRSARDA